MANRLPSVVIRLTTNRPRSLFSVVVLRHPHLRLLCMVGRHVTVYDAGLPGIDGESGHVTEYDPFNERCHVLPNNGHVYHLAPRHLQLTQAPAEAVQRPPMQKHPLPATVAPKYPHRSASTVPNRLRINLSPAHIRPHRTRSEARLKSPLRPRRGPCLRTEPSVKCGPPPKTQRPKILRSEPLSHGLQKAPMPLPPPARRTTLHYVLDGPNQPWPHRKAGRGGPLDASSACSLSSRSGPAKTASPTGYRQALCLHGLQEEDAYRGIPSRCSGQSPSGRCWYVARALGSRGRRIVNPRLPDGFRVRGALAPPRR